MITLLCYVNKSIHNLVMSFFKCIYISLCMTNNPRLLLFWRQKGQDESELTIVLIWHLKHIVFKQQVLIVENCYWSKQMGQSGIGVIVHMLLIRLFWFSNVSIANYVLVGSYNGSFIVWWYKYALVSNNSVSILYNIYSLIYTYDPTTPRSLLIR